MCWSGLQVDLLMLYLMNKFFVLLGWSIMFLFGLWWLLVAWKYGRSIWKCCWMFMEYPHVICTLMFNIFSVALCVELALWVIYGYLDDRACYSTYALCLSVYASIWSCVKVDLGLVLSWLEPHWVNPIEVMFLEWLVICFTFHLHVSLLLT